MVTEKIMTVVFTELNKARKLLKEMKDKPYVVSAQDIERQQGVVDGLDLIQELLDNLDCQHIDFEDKLDGAKCKSCGLELEVTK